jgi:hypothetical protein
MRRRSLCVRINLAAQALRLDEMWIVARGEGGFNSRPPSVPPTAAGSSKLLGRARTRSRRVRIQVRGMSSGIPRRDTFSVTRRMARRAAKKNVPSETPKWMAFD